MHFEMSLEKRQIQINLNRDQTSSDDNNEAGSSNRIDDDNDVIGTRIDRFRAKKRAQRSQRNETRGICSNNMVVSADVNENNSAVLTAVLYTYF